MAHRRWVVGLVVAIATVGGCAKDDKTATPASGSTTTVASTTAADATGVKVALLEPGAEPRRTLRLAIAEGAERRATMRMKLGLSQEIDGQKSPDTPTPPIDMVMTVKVTKTTANEIQSTFGYASVTVVDDGSVDPGVVRAVRSSGIDRLTDVKGTLRMTLRGEVIDASIDKPADFPAQLGQFVDQIEPQLQNLAVPFPAEAVGAGARWSAVTAGEISGIKLRNEYTYKLTELNGNAFKVDVTFKQTAPAQTAIISGISARILSFVTTGQGNLTGKLTELLPVTSTGRASGDQVVEINQEGTHRLNQHLTMEISLR